MDLAVPRGAVESGGEIRLLCTNDAARHERGTVAQVLEALERTLAEAAETVPAAPDARARR